ncbi:MAG: cysteine synthase A [Clostridia bacterium]|nr:cysteine synthase A [Clostridia bacterium]
MKILDNILQAVGSTPLVRLNNFSTHYVVRPIIAKVESVEPGGSIKDRAALEMVERAEREGKLKSGGTIIEPTSGNTGIGLAVVAACRGYKVVLTMPESMSIERRRLLAAYGARIVLTDAEEGMTGAIKKAKELLAATPGAFMPGQFDNPANPDAHYKTTAPEIWRDTEGEISVFVAGVGTGGTITGCARYLKEQSMSIKVVGAEPDDSPVLSGGQAGPHALQGIGAGFVPSVMDVKLCDDIIRVTTEQAFDCARVLAKKEGILCGISAGAALYAAVVASKKYQGNVVVVLPDTGDRYLSTELFGQ